MTVTNNCNDTVWPAIYGLKTSGGKAMGGGWELMAGTNFENPDPPNPNFYPYETQDLRTPYHLDVRASLGSNRVHWTKRTPNVLLAEWTFVQGDGDYFDISAVDAYHIGVSIEPVNGIPVDPSSPYGRCDIVTCEWKGGIESCPPEYQLKNKHGKLISCRNDDQDGQGVKARFFKKMCPDAYSWPYDDHTSTFRCRDPEGYRVVFCPRD
ncbi:hypothetical protein HDU67_010355 [Dinochytrium kinnereticum]|nr:hypothetical protein HDU67_010355 [Dinochytrium kinnereticum]